MRARNESAISCPILSAGKINCVRNGDTLKLKNSDMSYLIILQVIATALVEMRARNDSAMSCPTLSAGQIQNLQLSADCSGNGDTLKLKNPDMSVSVGCPSDMVLDNSTGGAERCCKIYHLYIHDVKTGPLMLVT